MLTGYKTYIGIILLLLPAIQKWTGTDITPDQLTQCLDTLATIIGGLLALYGRYVAKPNNTDTNATITQ